MNGIRYDLKKIDSKSFKMKVHIVSYLYVFIYVYNNIMNTIWAL